MKKGIIFFILLLFSCAVGVRAQQTNDDFCATAKKLAQETYDQGNYEKAKERFEYALQRCGEDDAEVKSWIAKCNAAIKGKADAETLRRKEAEAIQLAEEKRLAEERSEKELQARIEAERQEAEAKHLAEERAEKERQEAEAMRLAEERADKERQARIKAEQEAEAKRQQEIAAANAINNMFEMVYVEGGTFTMGCIGKQGNNCYRNEKPTHRVTLNGFYIGKTEVTQGQWDAVMKKNNCHGDWETLGDNCSANNVSWNDIQQFLIKLNNMQTQYTYRLPTEAEWEFAARGGNKSQGYKYSGGNNAGDVAWYFRNMANMVHSVGQKKGNELGLYDMSGSLYEWCYDWYDSYSSNAQTNPKGPSSGSYRVLRGGSWVHYARDARVTARIYNAPGFRSYFIGFRLACSPR